MQHSYRGRSELYRFDLASERLERVPTPEGVVSGAAVRDDGELWYAWQSGASPTEVRGPTGVLLEPPGERRPRGVAYSSHVVGDVQVFLAEPAGSPPFPTVVQVHGGPAGQDTANLTRRRARTCRWSTRPSSGGRQAVAQQKRATSARPGR